MVSMKYLIVTIASIFLALGIGIFIGFMFDGQDIFLNHQESLINDLEYKFDELKEENNELLSTIEIKNKNIKHYEDFTNIIFPKLIEGKLKGLKIAMIETNDDYIYNDINSIVLKSGGLLNSTTYIKKEFLLEKGEKLEEVYDYFTEKKQLSINKEDFIMKLSEYLAIAIIEKDIETLHFLKEKELIELKGNYMESADFFIIAGGSAIEEPDRMIQNIDIPIIKKVKQYNIPIIGVEQSIVKYSYIDTYKRQKISTIDNVDTMIGHYSLIEVLQGNYGNFGIKPSANRLIPQ
ncbi:MAG TPA: copper transporter [Eubacteriaceae bacterium]|nr:copper transporter [Eubacteriaceae bacterium]